MKALATLFLASSLVVPLAARASSSPTVTAPAPPSVSAAAFLAQLGTPKSAPRTGCSTSFSCPCQSGNPVLISCTGTTTCEVVLLGPPSHRFVGVECDGVVEQTCPGPGTC